MKYINFFILWIGGVSGLLYLTGDGEPYTSYVLLTVLIYAFIKAIIFIARPLKDDD